MGTAKKVSPDIPPFIVYIETRKADALEGIAKSLVCIFEFLERMEKEGGYDERGRAGHQAGNAGTANGTRSEPSSESDHQIEFRKARDYCRNRKHLFGYDYTRGCAVCAFMCPDFAGKCPVPHRSTDEKDISESACRASAQSRDSDHTG